MDHFSFITFAPKWITFILSNSNDIELATIGFDFHLVNWLESVSKPVSPEDCQPKSASFSRVSGARFNCERSFFDSLLD